mmetsp:Transcript_54/g.146  ORF Transcript_54/g.146 Transcript_54/m.146 type:complete len:847 (+) Transcript_54:433-2973(+)|eukprot:CAMPEP_0119561252 /NCGR_PEP_ID=MMETSP1352-20130426/17117_1 /TAXON_ID=265584 /ORGANISM="Stauroneis constricta, Strain CCMP1120" /LENGTH=846 /DNA_ID=CAMNT_0007609419 /DNA_START=395 /DNA_END=2935 /DNA_ORIENTATION=-
MPRSKALMKKRGAAAPKKIVIKPFSRPPKLPTNYYEETSRDLLQGTMKVVFSPTEAANLSLQNAYTQVVNLVSHQFGPKLYNDLVATFERACHDHVLPSLPADTPNLLNYIHAQYQQYVDYLLLCKHVFLPLDRTHTWSPGGIVKRIEGSSPRVGTPQVDGGGSNINGNGNSTGISAAGMYNMTNMTLWQVGLEQFRLRLVQFKLDDMIYQKWWESLKLDWDDNLAPDQQALLKSTLYMWQDLYILGPILHDKLEPDLTQFFRLKSQQLKDSDDGRYSATKVIDYCHSKWIHAAHNWSRFLPKTVCVTLLEIHLIQPHLHVDWLLSPANFDPMLGGDASSNNSAKPPPMSVEGAQPMDTTDPLQSDHPSHIQHLWMLAARIVEGTKLVSTSIAQYAKRKGLALTQTITDARIGKTRIEQLLDLQRRLQQIISTLPHASEHVTLKAVWEDVVNPPVNHSSRGGHVTDTNIVAESLARYVDSYLRDTKKQQALGTDSNAWASKIISGVFCFLQAKDVFEAFYKKDLARRLLWNRVVNMDSEKHFVSLLKTECGAGYTSKMEGMFQDMEWSRETMTRYKQSTMDLLGATTTKSSDDTDMDINVLTTGYWPMYPQFQHLILPDRLTRPRERFIEYYKTKYQGRRMTWQYSLGNCIVRFSPRGKGPTFDLILSLCQALVLVQFNDGLSFGIKQLMERVGIEKREEMERMLQSLSVGKDGTRVLVKQDYDADSKKKLRMTVHDDDTFVVREKFHSNSRRIRITNIMTKETKDDREKTVQAVNRDRLYLIDAVLVRIMKARKTIMHQQLLAQVLEQLKVPAQASDIKKRIETLIEREYLERDGKDRNRYNYLA